MPTNKTDDGIQGEGNYVAGRRFQDAERSFVATGPVEEKAREAAEALTGPEAEELEAARRETAEGDIHAKSEELRDVAARQPDESDPHTEENLDHGLDETFPASDPVSISPGSN